jgi:hypothetical protein
MAVYSQPNHSSQNSTILEIAKFLQGFHMVQTPKTFRAANLKGPCPSLHRPKICRSATAIKHTLYVNILRF